MNKTLATLAIASLAALAADAAIPPPQKLPKDAKVVVRANWTELKKLPGFDRPSSLDGAINKGSRKTLDELGINPYEDLRQVLAVAASPRSVSCATFACGNFDKAKVVEKLQSYGAPRQLGGTAAYKIGEKDLYAGLVSDDTILLGPQNDFAAAAEAFNGKVPGLAKDSKVASELNANKSPLFGVFVFKGNDNYISSMTGIGLKDPKFATLAFSGDKSSADAVGVLAYDDPNEAAKAAAVANGFVVIAAFNPQTPQGIKDIAQDTKVSTEGGKAIISTPLTPDTASTLFGAIGK